MGKGNKALLLFQISLLVLSGSAFVLFALWVHLSEHGPIALAIASAGLLYLGFLSRVFWGDKEKWLYKTVAAIWAPLWRASILFVVALLANTLAIVLLIGLRGPVEVHLVLSPEPLSVQLKGMNADFQIQIDIPNHPPIATRHSHDKHVNLTLPRLNADTEVQFVVEHPTYEPVRRPMKFREALNGVTINLVPRPALVVRLEQGNTCDADAGLVGAVERQHLPLSPNQSACFVAQSQEDWQVTVTDLKTKSVHRSPLITINQKVKAYVIGANADWVRPDQALASTSTLLIRPQITIPALAPNQLIAPRVTCFWRTTEFRRSDRPYRIRSVL
jgi:hypothetical protein